MNNQNLSQPRNSLISKLVEWLLYILLFSSTFLFIPTLGNPFDVPKLLLLVIIGGLIGILWSIRVIHQKNIFLTLGTPQISLFIFAVVVALSTYVQKIYAINVISNTFGVLTTLALVSLLSSEMMQKTKTLILVQVSAIFGIVLTLLGFLQAIGFGFSSIINTIFSTNLNETFLFSTTGSSLVTLSFLGALLLPLGMRLYQGFEKNQKLTNFSFELVSGAIIISGILFHSYLFLTKAEYTPQIIPISANWSLVADTIKTPKELLLGFGPTHFVDAYTANRPVSLNSTKHWNVVYQIGANTPLTMAVSTGIISTLAWLYLGFYLLFKIPKTDPDAQPAGWLALGSIIIQLLLPPNILLLTVEFIALAFFFSAQNHAHKPTTTKVVNFALRMFQGKKQNQAKTPATILGTYLAGAVVIIATILTYSGMLTIIRAESYFNQASQAFRDNQASKAYELQKKGVSINPYNDNYHRTYAQTNLTLATAIGNKADATAEEKQTVAQLLQQAIRESRVAASINPYRSANWRTMAMVYRALVGSTKGADQWTVAAYNQAIQTSPNDPTLRVDLGGLFYFAKNYEIAEQLFQQSVTLKPDYANGYYNLAKAREQANKYSGAVLAYQQVLRLVNQDTDDYITAQKELSILVDNVNEEQAKIAKQQPAVTPTPTPEAEATPAEPKKVELPDEAKEDVAILEQEPDNPQLATESATINP